MTVTQPMAAMAVVDEFAVSTNSTPATLLHRGVPVGPVQATQMDGQFSLPGGGYLLLASDTTPYHEHMAIIYLDASGRVRDTALVGGAYTPGTLSYAYPTGPATLVFCFHDLEHEVTVAKQTRWFGLKRRWLHLREPEHVNE